MSHATTPSFIGVTELPRAGSTLLCQLLAQHPGIGCAVLPEVLSAAGQGL